MNAFTKHFEIRSKILADLLEPERKIFQQIINSISERNTKLTDTGKPAFMHMGSVYAPTGALPNEYGSLHISLGDEMDTALAHYRQAENTAQAIWQAFVPCLEMTGMDIKTSFPPELDSLPTIFNTQGKRTQSFPSLVQALPEYQQKIIEKVIPQVQLIASMRLVIE